MELYADIDGTPVPLRLCDWIMTEECGCIIAVTLATHHNGDLIAATAEQAHKEIVASKRERDRDLRLGRTVQIITHEAFKERTKGGAIVGWKCELHAAEASAGAGAGD